MSSPTMRFRSERLSIADHPRRLACCAPRAAPADCKTVRVTHVDVGNVARRAARRACSAVLMNFSKRSSTWRRPSRTVTPLARSNSQAPRASRRSAVRRMPGLHQASLRGEITLRDHRLLAIGTGQLRAAPAGCGARRGVEQLAARIEQSALAPARRRDLLDHQHVSPRGQARCTLTASTQGIAWIARAHGSEIH